MSKDPAWIPKPPVLYGSDKLEIFQPYDPETPASTTPPLGSPSCPGSPSDSSSSGSVTIPIPSFLPSIKTAAPVSTSASVIPTQPTSSCTSDNNPTTSSDKKALPSILTTLFSHKSSDSTTSSDAHSTKPAVSTKKVSMPSDVSRSMLDPIVQQYGQKSKVKKMEDEENYLDRPYDPEEEYDPAMGYKTVAPQALDKVEADDAKLSDFVEDDVAYDPEDETIFQDIQSDTPATKPPIPDETLDSPSCPTPVPTSAPAQMSVQTTVTSNLPTGTVVVSAATLTEQQRMLEELNKQIEEQKRQLKEQEEALRQQREAVGMFMAQFSVSDSLMSPPGKTLPLNKLPSLQSSLKQMGSKPSESANVCSLRETSDGCNIESAADHQNVNIETTATVEQDESHENAEDSNKSAGEIEDSDVAYDPEDESLFDEIQDDVFKGSDSLSVKSGLSGSLKGASPNSYKSRRHRSSPKKRSRHDRDHHRSPSRQSQQRSPSHSRRHRERERHRKSERDRSRHRGRDHSERQGHHRKGRTTRRHSHGQRRSSSSSRKRHSMSPSPQPSRGPFPEVYETSKLASVSYNAQDSVEVERSTSSSSSFSVTRNDPGQSELECNLGTDKISTPCSQKQLHNTKLEISEPQKCPSPQKPLVTADTAIADDAPTALSSQVEKSCQQRPQLHDKLVTTVPLRELDPPIRDSPESPDPEPQFVKPSNTVQEENKEPVGLFSLSSGDYATESNEFSLSGQDVGNQTNDKTLDFGFSQSLNVGNQGVIETEKSIKRESSSLMHSELSYSGAGPDIGQKFAIATSKSVGAHSVPKNEDKDLSMKGVLTDGSDKVDLGSRSHLSVVDHLNTDARQPSEVGEKKLLKDENSHADMKEEINVHCKAGGLNLSCHRQEILHPDIGAQRNAHPDYRVSGIGGASPAMKSQGLDSHSRNLNWSGSESDVRNDWRGLDHSRLGPGTEGAFVQNNWRILQADREGVNIQKQTSGVIGECQKFGQSGPAMRDSSMQPTTQATTSILGPRPENIRLDSDTPVHDRRAPAPDFTGPKETGPAMDIQRPDLREKGPPDFVRPEPENTGLAMGDPGPNLREHLGPQFRRPDVRGSEIRGLWPERRSPGFVGPGPYGHGPWGPGSEPTGPRLDGVWSERQNIEAPESKMPGPESKKSCIDSQGPEGTRPTGPDLRASIGRGPEMGVQRLENRVFGPPDFLRPRPERRSQAIEAIGPGEVGPGGPEFNLSGPHNGGFYMDGAGPDQRKNNGPDFRGQQPENRGLCIVGPGSNRGGPGGPEFRVPQPENIGLSMDGPILDRRGSGGPQFRAPLPENRSSFMEGPHLEPREPGGPDFRGPGPDSRGLSMEGPRLERREPGGPDFRGPGPDSRGSSMAGPRLERREAGGPEFRRPGPDNRVSCMDGPRPDRRGPADPEFMGPGPRNRDFPIDGAGGERRGPGGPGFRSTGPGNRDLLMDGPRPERRGPGGPQLRGPLPENRASSMESPWPEHRQPGGPDFRGPDPNNRDLSMDGPRPDRRGHGGPEFRRSGPENRDLSMDGPQPGRKGPGGPQFRGPLPENRGSSMEDLWPEHREPGGSDFSSPGPDNRNLSFDGPRPDRRGPGGPQLRKSGPENRELSMDGSRPDRRGPEGPQLRRSGPENRDLSLDGPRPDRRGPGGPQHRGPLPEKRGSSIEGPWPEHREPGGPEFRGPGPENRGLSMDGPGPEKRGPGPTNRPRLSNRGVSMDGSGPDFRSPGHDNRGLPFDGPGHDHRGPRGPDFRGTRPENRGLSLDGPGPVERGPRGPDFRGPHPENRDLSIAGPGSDRKRPGGPDLGEPGFDGRGPAGGMRSENRLSSGPDFIGPGPEWRGPVVEGPVNDLVGSRDPNFRAQGPGGRGSFMEGSRPGRRGPGGPDFSKPGPGGPDFSRPGPRGRGSTMSRPRPDRRVSEGSSFSWSEHEQGERGLNFKGPGFERRPPIDGSLPAERRAPGEQNYHGQGFDQNLESSQSGVIEPNSIGPSSEEPEFKFRRGMRPPVMGALQPIRKGPGHQDFRESGYVREEPDSEGLHTDKQESEDYSFRESGFEMSDSHFEDPEPDWIRSHEPDCRKPGIRPNPPHSEVLRHDGRDDWGGSEEQSWQGPFHERRGCRGRGGRGLSFRQVPRPRIGAQDEWNDSGDSGPRKEHLDEWREPDHGDSRPFYQDNERHGEDSQPDHLHMGNDKRQPAFRGRLRAPRGKGRGDFITDPGSVNSYHSRREFEMESCDRRGPGGLRLQRPGNRNFSVQDPNEGPGTQRFENNLRQERRGVVGPVHDSRGPDAMHREPEQRGPHQFARHQDSRKLHLVNRPVGSDPNRGGKMFPGQPPRPRGALLPTPKEGLIRFPNHMIKNADVSSVKQNIKSQPVHGQQSKSVSQQGQVTSQELGSPTVKTNTPAVEKKAED
uniref:Death inducer-obliterator 1 n=2 Tax=Salarias fasciatus TaxID=181472 RepID=A0A672J666_SALFA